MRVRGGACERVYRYLCALQEPAPLTSRVKREAPRLGCTGVEVRLYPADRAAFSPGG